MCVFGRCRSLIMCDIKGMTDGNDRQPSATVYATAAQRRAQIPSLGAERKQVCINNAYMQTETSRRHRPEKVSVACYAIIYMNV